MRTLLAGASGLAVGALLAGALAVAFDGGESADGPAAGEVTTSTAPDGPVALSEDLRIEPAWLLERRDRLLIGVHILSEPGTTPELPSSAAWSLLLDDGREVPFSADYASFLAPGVVTVEFPGDGIEPADLEALVVRPATRSLEVTGTWEVPAGELPWRGPPPGPIATAEGFTLMATDVRIGDDGGSIEWQLFGASGRRTVLDAEASWTVPGDDLRRVAAAEYRIGDTPLQLSPLRPNARWSGSLELYRLDDPQNPTFRSRWWGDPGPVTIDGLTVEFRATVYEYADDGIPVPHAGIPRIAG